MTRLKNLTYRILKHFLSYNYSFTFQLANPKFLVCQNTSRCLRVAKSNSSAKLQDLLRQKSLGSKMADLFATKFALVLKINGKEPKNILKKIINKFCLFQKTFHSKAKLSARPRCGQIYMQSYQCSWGTKSDYQYFSSCSR